MAFNLELECSDLSVNLNCFILFILFLSVFKLLQVLPRPFQSFLLSSILPLGLDSPILLTKHLKIKLKLLLPPPNFAAAGTERLGGGSKVGGGGSIPEGGGNIGGGGNIPVGGGGGNIPGGGGNVGGGGSIPGDAVKIGGGGKFGVELLEN